MAPELIRITESVLCSIYFYVFPEISSIALTRLELCTVSNLSHRAPHSSPLILFALITL
jgi:hypothetical protein